MIGFDPETYCVREDAGFAIVTVKVLMGTLGREVTVDFFTTSGTATSKSVKEDLS